MNLFDLRGPEFLLAYAVIAAAIILVARQALRVIEGDGGPPALQKDPYTIAYLRGGAREVLRVATLSLIDRGLLVVEEEQLRQRDGEVVELVEHPVERRLLAAGAAPCAFSDIGSRANRAAVKAHFEGPLRAEGLLPQSTDALARVLVFLLAAGVLWAIAGHKLALAAERGHSNVAFLWLLAILATVTVGELVFRQSTPRAKRVVAARKHLLAGLKRRANTLRAGHDPVEVLQLAAAFGIFAVPEAVAPQRALLGLGSRRWVSSTTDGNAGGCGSVMGSGCGSSCGGGCGGCGS